MTTNTSTISEINETLAYGGPKHLDEIGYGVEEAGERNRLRAFWAANALKAFVDICHTDTIEAAISDLIADLRHLAAGFTGEDGEPIDEAAFTDLQNNARDRWAEEAYDCE